MPGSTSLSPGDIDFIKNFRRTFESMLASESACREGSAPKPKDGGTKNQRSDCNLSVEPGNIAAWNATYEAYKIKSDELKDEVPSIFVNLAFYPDCTKQCLSLQQHMKIAGREQTVQISDDLEYLVQSMRDLDSSLAHGLTFMSDDSMVGVMRSLRNITIGSTRIRNALNQQKHAFHFRHLLSLQSDSWTTRIEFESQSDLEAKLALLYDDIVPRLTERRLPDLVDELRTFSTSAFPSHVVQEEERATTRYLALTTIATFFSSITATTLQFSYQQTAGGLSIAVNVFWFLSLVFSVSSGINSLLSMLWRKSTVYSNTKPPKYINFWLTKAPMVFLAVSAFAFVVGLNLFPYSSHQHILVSTTTNIFTVLHVLGVLIVTSWYLVRLKWSTLGFKLFRRYILWICLRDEVVMRANYVIGDLIEWSANTSSSPHPTAQLLRRSTIVIRALSRGLKRLFMPMHQRMEHCRHIIVKFVKHTVNLAMVASKQLEHAFSSFSEALKHISCLNPRSDLPDLESGTNNTSEIAGDWDEFKAVDESASRFTRSVDEASVGQFYQECFNLDLKAWKARSVPTDMVVGFQKLRLWGFPVLLQLFMDEVLPTMRAVDEVRARLSREQAPVSSCSESLGSSSIIEPLISPFPEDEEVGGLVTHVETCAPLPSWLNTGNTTGLVASDTEPSHRNPTFINMSNGPTSADEDQVTFKTSSPPPIVHEEQVSLQQNDGPTAMEDSKTVSVREGIPEEEQGTKGSPVPLETEVEDSNMDWNTEPDLLACLSVLPQKVPQN